MKPLFVMTHLGSGWQEVVTWLKRDPKFDFFQTDTEYHHPGDLVVLFKQPHRRINAAAVWGDVVLHNKDFTCRALCDVATFVFWCRPLDMANAELDGIADKKGYYSSRVGCLREYFHKVKRGFWNPVLEGDSLLEAILGGKGRFLNEKTTVTPW